MTSDFGDMRPAERGEQEALAGLRQTLADLKQGQDEEQRAGRAEIIVESLVMLGAAALLPRIGALLVAWAELGIRPELRKNLWGIGDAKRDFSKVVEAARQRGPQLIADKKSSARSAMVMLEAEAVEGIAGAFEALALPQYATGAEMARILSHDGEPSRMSGLPRRPTPVVRRRLPKGGVSAADPELRPRRTEGAAGPAGG